MFRGLTLDEAAEAAAGFMQISDGSINRIEQGLQPYSQDSLLGLAKVYDCDPIDLLVTDPGQGPSIWRIWAGLSEQNRKIALGQCQVLLDSQGGGEPPADPPRQYRSNSGPYDGDT